MFIVMIYCGLWECMRPDRLVVVPSEDSHQSEYIAPCDGRRGGSYSYSYGRGGGSFRKWLIA